MTMAKFSKITKLTEAEAIHLLKEFFDSVSALHGRDELTKIFSDLLSKQELVMVARRLKIAKLLLDGNTYLDAVKKTKCSMATVARISVWLNSSGEGYRLIHQRKIGHGEQGDKPNVGWSTLKRRFPVYFWPQLITEGIRRQISKRELKQIRKVLQDLDNKSRMIHKV